jgi:hypothetical protein
MLPSTEKFLKHRYFKWFWIPNLKIWAQSYDEKKSWGTNFPQRASSQMLESKLQGVKFVQIKCFLYHWKILKA